MLKAVSSSPPADLEPHWPEPPCLIEEIRGSPFGYRSRKIPESPRLAELARLAINLGTTDNGR
jgi:hypothetical protein